MELIAETTPLLTTTSTDNSAPYGSTIIYIENDGKQHEIPSLNENESNVIKNNPEKDEDENYLWYLAYGSNMNRAIFVERRANPYMEPTYANILRFSPPLPIDGSHPTITREYAWEVHRRCNTGVLYKITKKQYQMLVISEGVWGWDDVPLGYKDIDVECVTYDGEKIIARTLIVKPECISSDLQISERYHNILQEGAREHNMDVNYQTYLATKIMPYKITTTRKKIAKALFLVLFFPLLFILIVVSLISMKTGMRVPRWFAVYLSYLWEGMHTVHNRLFEPYFGSGNNTLDVEQLDKIKS
ncbi:9874_t:CDS:2 [Ambispora gerdemannii]|uniref:gamma-glutamylcyclotransferase n=1 Tax=Ambispora gerdemannii TaxID=144530 RepID=A0A9N8VH78_9GLOM|nr:9874_t:CDS:2 [Ambispora gerdemannii]